MISAPVGHYRCPDDFLQLELEGPLSPDSGYFRFGNNAICYGRSSTGYRTPKPDALLYNALDDLRITGAKVLLPFDPTEIITNLRMERYARRCRPSNWNWRRRFLRDTYYYLRPRMGVGVRKFCNGCTLADGGISLSHAGPSTPASNNSTKRYC